MTVNNEASAYPVVTEWIERNTDEGGTSILSKCTYSGLTKREYFIALSLQGFIATGKKTIDLDNIRKNLTLPEAAIATADELLAKL